MTGRGIDQVLPHPNDPTLHESYVKDARSYVELAEQVNGSISAPVDFDYIWGDAIAEWKRVTPDLRLINLETSITRSDDYWQAGKGVHYRMHPANLPCLSTARIDCCALANNHVLDWGYAGLIETLDTLKAGQIKYTGVGRTLQEAATPAVLPIAGKGRVLVFSLGAECSGIPASWGATPAWPGVNLLEDFSERTVQRLTRQIQAAKRPGDLVVVSIHWGGNWGYEIPSAHRQFAHRLIEQAGVDLIHGHSSHHVKGIEVYQDKLILYGCGDFLTDYEGITGYEAFRGDLGLMYFPSVEPATGKLVALQMTPTQLRRFQIHRASPTDAQWLSDALNREGQRLGTQVTLNPDSTLTLQWR